MFKDAVVAKKPRKRHLTDLATEANQALGTTCVCPTVPADVDVCGVVAGPLGAKPRRFFR